jgi:hypothetical protein
LIGIAPSGGVALGSSTRGLFLPDEFELPMVSDATLQASFSISFFFWDSTTVSEMLKQRRKIFSKGVTEELLLQKYAINYAAWLAQP